MMLGRVDLRRLNCPRRDPWQAAADGARADRPSPDTRQRKIAGQKRLCDALERVALRLGRRRTRRNQLLDRARAFDRSGRRSQLEQVSLVVDRDDRDALSSSEDSSALPGPIL